MPWTNNLHNYRVTLPDGEQGDFSESPLSALEYLIENFIAYEPDHHSVVVEIAQEGHWFTRLEFPLTDWEEFFEGSHDMYNYLAGKIIGSATLTITCGDVSGDLKTTWEAVNEP